MAAPGIIRGNRAAKVHCPISRISRAVRILGDENSDPKSRRRVLAKEFARADVAPQCGHGLMAGLFHDDELPNSVHGGLRYAARPERVTSERIRIHLRTRRGTFQNLADGIFVKAAP